MIPASIRQKQFRERRAERLDRMRVALEAIVSRLDDNDKPLAVELREIATRGLETSTQEKTNDRDA